MYKTTVRSKHLRVKVNPEEDEMFQELKTIYNCKNLSECLRELVRFIIKTRRNNEQISNMQEQLMPIFHLIANMPFDEFNELMQTYVYSDLTQKDHEEIEREIYEEDTKFKNELMASNFANFKPKSPSKRKNTQIKRKKKSTAKKPTKKPKKK